MKIIAIHPYEKQHLNEVIPIAQKYGEVTLRGSYDDFNDVFYLLEGCHRVEAAYQLKLPLTLINYDQFDKIDVELPGLNDYFQNGFILIDKIFEFGNWIGKVYNSNDFKSVEVVDKPLF